MFIIFLIEPPLEVIIIKSKSYNEVLCNHKKLPSIFRGSFFELWMAKMSELTQCLWRYNEHINSQIIFTIHQIVPRRTLKGGSFSKSSKFHFILVMMLINSFKEEILYRLFY